MIQYNSLNLPTVIAFTDGSTTKYTYDAAGRKLRTEHKVMTTAAFHPEIDDAGDAGIAPDPAEEGIEAEAGEGEVGEEWPQMPSFEELEQLLGEEIAEEEGMEAGEEPTLPPMEPTDPTQPTVPAIFDDPSAYQPYELTVTDYCGNFIYENGKLSRILFDGGFITFPDTTVNGKVIADISRPQYHYTFTDHLGSIRVVTDAQGNVEQTNNYYPYGGLMATSSSIANPVSKANVAANQPNRYNGKELDRKNGLDWLDYGARHFAGHGHWTSPDPLAEKYYDWSPYAYCVGNPIKFVDPDGRMVKPGDFFRTADAAALDFGMFYNDNSIRKDREMWSHIVKVKNEKGEIGYTYAPAIVGNKHSSKIYPPPANGVAFVHTHGGYSGDYYDNEFSGVQNNNTSRQEEKGKKEGDLVVANTYKIDAYVATPNGSLQKYDHKTGNISTLSKNLPSDVTDPERLNRVDAKHEKHSNTRKGINVMFQNYFRLQFNYIWSSKK